MAVTEIALLSIKASFDAQNPSDIPHQVLKNLHHAASEQANYSGYSVALLQGVDDPTQLLLIGGWESVSHHMDDWIPGPINQRLLKLLSDDVDVRFMFHLETDPLRVMELVHTNGDDEGMQIGIGLFAGGDGQRSAWETGLKHDDGSGDPGHNFTAVYARRLDLGYVADGNEPEMQEVEKTIVVFARSGGTEDSNLSVFEMFKEMEGKAIGTNVHTVKVIRTDSK